MGKKTRLRKKTIEQNKLLIVENQLLRTRLDEARQENNLYKQTTKALARTDTLQSHLNIAYPMMQDNIRPTHLIVINKGYYEGIKQGQAVLSKQSIIGQVIAVFSHTAQTKLFALLHPLLLRNLPFFPRAVQRNDPSITPTRIS